MSELVVVDTLAILDCGAVTADEQWRERALCAQTDPEAFFPEKGGSTRAAKAICRGCDVAQQCLAYALDNDERYGIWGGLSERERRRLKHGLDPDAISAEFGDEKRVAAVDLTQERLAG
jgi:WhiB family redox-sensing transcriptional regulator